MNCWFLSPSFSPSLQFTSQSENIGEMRKRLIVKHCNESSIAWWRKSSETGAMRMMFKEEEYGWEILACKQNITTRKASQFRLFTSFCMKLPELAVSLLSNHSTIHRLFNYIKLSTETEMLLLKLFRKLSWNGLNDEDSWEIKPA